MGHCKLFVGLVIVGLLASQATAQRPAGRAGRRLPGNNAAPLKTVTWKVGDVTREALVYEPTKSDPEAKRPLVFAFHGHGGRAQFAARRLNFHELWPEAVCVYPQGLPTAVPVIDVDGKLPGWQKSIGDQGDRDLAFFDAMLKTMIADHRIDERRVYVAGHSNGGFFTYLLCAARGDKLAAVAPIAAAVNPKDVKSQKALPVFHVAGETDKLVRFAAQERSLERVRAINGCEPKGQASGKWCTEYRSPTGTPVVTFIHPGGHAIPEEAPPRIVAFFKEHVRRE